MKLQKLALTLVVSLAPALSFAAHIVNGPECAYWTGQLVDLQDRLTTAQDGLKTCDTATSQCHDLKRLIRSLKMEKASTEKFLANNCQ